MSVDSPGAATAPAAPAAPTVKREVWETDLGVVLYEPTPARNYYRLVYRDHNGKRHQPSAGKDRDAAWRLALEKDAELAATITDNSARSIKELNEQWLVTVKKNNSAHQYVKYTQMSSRFIVPELGGLPSWKLSRKDVQDLLEKPDKPSSRRHLGNALGAMLIWAHSAEQQWTPQPREFYLPKKPRTAQSSAGAQHGESHQFIDPSERPSAAACRDLAATMRAQALENVRDGKRAAAALRWAEQMWLFIAVAASCGLRQGELMGLTVGQLRFARSEIFVDRQLVRVNGMPPHTTLPKWGRKRATVLPTLTLWGEPLAARLAVFVEGLDAGALVFPARRGGWLHASNFSRRHFDPARHAAPAWANSWSGHALRHAFCSHLLSDEGGKLPARDTDVAHAAGHRDTGVTRAMYVGQTAGALGRLNANLNHGT